jgi:hypothetical protein
MTLSQVLKLRKGDQIIVRRSLWEKGASDSIICMVDEVYGDVRLKIHVTPLESYTPRWITWMEALRKVN